MPWNVCYNTKHSRYRNIGTDAERQGVRHGECDWQTKTEQFIVWYLVKDVSTIFIVLLTGHAEWQTTNKVFLLTHDQGTSLVKPQWPEYRYECGCGNFCGHTQIFLFKMYN